MSDRNLRIRLLFEAMEKVTGPLRAIAGGAGSTGAKIKAMRDRLKELDRAQADIGSFRQLKAGIKGTEDQLRSAENRVAQLARAMRETESPTKKMAADFARAKREAAALKQDLSSQGMELQQLRGRLSAAGISTSKLGDHQRELRLEASRLNRELSEQARKLQAADDRAARFAAGKERFSKVQGAATGLAAGGAAALGTGTAIAAPVVATVKESSDFQSTMTDIAQKADMARDQAEKMGRAFDVLGPKVAQLPADLAAGVDVLAGRGLDPRRGGKMIEPIGRAATAYKAKVNDLADATFSTVDNLKVPIGQTAKALDVMAAAGKAGAFEMKDMAQYFPALTASANALGQKGVPAVADLAAALQITRKGAGDSSTAANNLQNLLNKINTEDTIKNFKQFGIDLPKAMKKAAKDGKSPIEAIAELTSKATKGDLSKLAFLFGDAQVQAALRPLLQNMDLYRKIRADALDATGTVEADFNERMQDTAAKWQRTKASAQALAHTIGRGLLPAANWLAEKGATFSDWASAMAQRYPTAAKWLGIIVGGIAALLLVFGALALGAAALMAPFAAIGFMSAFAGGGFLALARFMLLPLRVVPLLINGVWALAGGIAKAGLFLLANPMIAGILILVAAVGFAGYMIWKHWATISAAFTSAVGRIGAALQAARAWIVSAFNGIFAFFAGLGLRFQQFGANLIQGLISGITGRLSALKNTIVGAANAAANWFKSKLGIRSPSRVFMGLGSFVMQGLERGIASEENAPLRRLDRLSRNMAAALAIGSAAPAIAAGAGSAPGTASGAATASAFAAPITINIYSAPGQSAEDIGRQVRAELERARNGERARGNSSFADRSDWEDS